MANKFVYTITSLLKKAIQKIDRFDAELILAYILKKNREFIVTYRETQLSFSQTYCFWYFVYKRSRGIPLAYITGHKEFFGLDFIVNKYTLIPRPDTEILVETILKEIPTHDFFIDIGTGTGCIPIAVQKNISNKKYPIFASDISKRALHVAKQNAFFHHAAIEFLQGDLLTPFLKKNISFDKKKILLSANLPYLTKTQFKNEPSIQHEPYSALVAHDEGLFFYRELLKQIKKYGIHGTFFFEIDPSQTKKIISIGKDIFPRALITIHQDTCHRDRIFKLSL